MQSSNDAAGKNFIKKFFVSKRNAFLSFVLVMIMVLGIVPSMSITTQAAGEDLFSIGWVESTHTEPNGTTSMRNWNATVTQKSGATVNTRYNATIVVAMLGTSQYELSGNYKFQDTATSGISIYDTGCTVTPSGSNYSYSVAAIIQIENKTAQEIQDYLNNSLYVYSSTDGNYPWIKPQSAIVNNASIVGYTVKVQQSSGDTDQTVSPDGTDIQGIGTIKINGTSYNFGDTLTVAEGAAVTVEFTAVDPNYLAAYSVTGSEDSADDVQLTSKTIEVTANSDMTVSALFLKKVALADPRVPADSDKRANPGALKWAQDAGTSISYKAAVADQGGFNFNAAVSTYLLNSEFGTSIYYGQSRLPDPSVYMVLTQSSGPSVTVGTATEFQSLGKIGGRNPNPSGVALTVDLPKSQIVPGEVNQAVYADYTTAGSICVNHWYHVYGVKGHSDKILRTFTIEKDVLGFYNGDIATALGNSFTFNSEGNVEGFNPQLLPASYGETASQAKTDYTSQNAYNIYDSEGNPVPNNKITKSGSYTIKNKAFTETTYIQGYEANTIEFTFNVEKGTNPVSVTKPVVKSQTANSITVDTASIVDGQKYSVDGGQTWITGAQLRAAGGVFSGLTEGTTYTVQTVQPATDMYLEQSVNADPAVTYVKVEGSIKLDDNDTESAPLLKAGTVVTFTSPAGVFTTVVDANGNYSTELPLGTYSVSSLSAEGEQSGTLASYTVADNTPDAPETVPAITVKDTTVGAAKKAVKAIDLAASNEKAAIDAMEHLTTEEKDALKAVIDAAVETAKAAVSTAGSIEDVEAYAAKAKAVAGIKAAEAKALDTVMAQNALTDEEKKVFKDKISAAANTAVGDVEALDINASDFSDALNGIVDTVAEKMNGFADEAVAADFVKVYVTGEDGGIYSAIDSQNADQILSGKTAWAGMTDEQKEKADALIAAANSGISGAPQSYEEFVQKTETFVDEASDKFIEKYLTGKNGKIYKNANDQNYAQILSGKSSWNKMSKAEQDAINEKLLANGGKTYPKLLEVARSIQESKDRYAAGLIKTAYDFIYKYLVGADGNIYKEVTSQNYAQIISGKGDWDKMTQEERDVTNALLTENGYKTYEELLRLAEAFMNSSVPKTGDDANPALWFALLMISAVGALGVLKQMRRKEA